MIKDSIFCVFKNLAVNRIKEVFFLNKKISFFFSGCRPRFARLAALPLPRACIALTKFEEKERLLAV